MKKEKDYIVKPTKVHDIGSGEFDPMPFINIIPAIIYAVIITNQYIPDTWMFWEKFGVGAAFVVVYMIACYIPFVCIIPAVASLIMYAGMIWALCDKVGNQIVRIILKVVTAGFVGLMEFSVAVSRIIKKQDFRRVIGLKVGGFLFAESCCYVTMIAYWED